MPVIPGCEFKADEVTDLSSEERRESLCAPSNPGFQQSREKLNLKALVQTKGVRSRVALFYMWYILLK